MTPRVAWRLQRSHQPVSPSPDGFREDNPVFVTGYTFGENTNKKGRGKPPPKRVSYRHPKAFMASRRVS